MPLITDTFRFDLTNSQSEQPVLLAKAISAYANAHI